MLSYREIPRRLQLAIEADASADPTPPCGPPVGALLGTVVQVEVAAEIILAAAPGQGQIGPPSIQEVKPFALAEEPCGDRRVQALEVVLVPEVRNAVVGCKALDTVLVLDPDADTVGLGFRARPEQVPLGHLRLA